MNQIFFECKNVIQITIKSHLEPRNRLPIRRAVSLIELIMVLLLVGIVTAVSAPRFSKSLQQYRVDSAAKRVALDLTAARRSAKSSGKNVEVTFTQKMNSYAITNLKSLNRDRSEYSVDLAAVPYHCELKSVSFPAAKVTFDRFQRPDNGGTLVLKCGSLTKIVSLNATTGEVAIQ